MSFNDLKNCLDTAFADGKAAGKREAHREIVEEMQQDGFTIDMIVEYTDLTIEDIENCKL